MKMCEYMHGLTMAQQGCSPYGKQHYMAVITFCKGSIHDWVGARSSGLQLRSTPDGKLCHPGRRGREYPCSPEPPRPHSDLVPATTKEFGHNGASSPGPGKEYFAAEPTNGPNTSYQRFTGIWKHKEWPHIPTRTPMSSTSDAWISGHVWSVEK